MEATSKATACAVLLMLLLISHNGGGGGVAEARVCTGKSQHHSFPCVSDRLCASQCAKQEGGWTAGYCHFRVCTCQKSC
ncbi:hypothetical protein GUJ93_ZPchr0010g8311 [Zizania palustris]|uniref:Knottins-like domain-containing protein n=1 Tax=Zizania palustris TaxID=103762 RepID=A0A8J5RGN2_ZIZPA|nr:hypothetical protein GUJ93_ZPchr0034g18722 [Zizania palustris]KAG8086962.1 hypothetical protein GUJ93_ZPchr0010g8311 [Zizania palustris]